MSLAFLALACCAAAAQSSGRSPAFEAALAEQRPGRNVSKVGELSDYVPALAGTAMDSPVYFIDPEAPAPGAPEPRLPAILILGGTHGDEIAGVVAASLFVSWARPVHARLIILPRANASAACLSDPDRPGPPLVVLPGASGARSFRYGSRFTALADEALPDPFVFFPTGAGPDGVLPGRESRNLNRNYPGDPNGSPTARAAAAIFALIGAENVRAAFDLHEAGPSSGLAWDIVAHPKNLEYAAMGVLAASDRGVNMVLDQSREEHRGLSHREWGERTGAAAYLIETLNPGQVAGGLPDFDQLDNPRFPLWKRVGIQIETILAILGAHAEMDQPSGWALIQGMPDLDDLKNDFSRYF